MHVELRERFLGDVLGALTIVHDEVGGPDHSLNSTSKNRVNSAVGSDTRVSHHVTEGARSGFAPSYRGRHRNTLI